MSPSRFPPREFQLSSLLGPESVEVLRGKGKARGFEKVDSVTLGRLGLAGQEEEEARVMPILRLAVVRDDQVMGSGVRSSRRWRLRHGEEGVLSPPRGSTRRTTGGRGAVIVERERDPSRICRVGSFRGGVADATRA